MQALLVALDLVAPGFVPRPLRCLYRRTIGAAAAAVREGWESTADDWGDPA